MNSQKRIAILADIHANSIALQAVLVDIQAQGGVDEYWCLGDYVALGHDPVGTLELLAALPTAHFVRGNTDRYVISEAKPGPSATDIREDISLLSRYTHMIASFSWTLGALATSGWLPWLEKLPLEIQTLLPDGTRTLVVHAAPGLDDGDGIHPATSDEQLRMLVSTAQADLLLVGHTHIPFDRRIGNIRVVNPGSVSNVFPPDLRASYALLEAGQDGYRLDFRRVDYDRAAVIAALQRWRHPARGYITRFMRGENRPEWK